jgi:hypothetical protein
MSFCAASDEIGHFTVRLKLYNEQRDEIDI